MYFRFQQQVQALTVEDDFAELVNINDAGDYEFEFTYSVSQGTTIEHNARKVVVTVESQNVLQKSLLGSPQRGQVNTRDLVDNIRTAVIDAKSAAQQQQRYVIASRDSDLTACINNEIIPQLLARTPSSQIPALNRPRLKLVTASSLKQKNDPQPVLHRIANSAAVPDIQLVLSASTVNIARNLMFSMVTQQGIDPSYVTELTHRSMSESESHGGLSNTQRALERTTDPAARLLNMYLFPTTSGMPPTTTQEIDNTEQVQVLQTVTSDVIDVPVDITLPAAQLSPNGQALGQVFVTFELIDSQTNLALDSVTKTLDLTKHLRVFSTPRVPPIVKASSSTAAPYANLEIKQVDAGASEVDVYKKSVWTSSTDVDSYTLIGSYALAAGDQPIQIQVDQPTRSPVVYRVVPVGNSSIKGFEFTNVVIKPGRYAPVFAVALVASQIDSGIRLEVRHLPTNAVAVQFLRWNTTTFDSTPTIAPVLTQRDPVVSFATDSPNPTNVAFIDDAARQADILTAVDSGVFDGNIYRYVARVIYRDGMTNDFGDATLGFVQPAPGQVITKISDLTVSHDVGPNVTFNISTSTLATDLDAVKQMLENQGLSSFFTGDIAAQRSQLASLIAHRVDRVDLNTGVRESFGITTAASFDDAALGKPLAVQPLVYGHRYRYEVYPLLRAPETMFDDLVKQAVDPTTKKSYSFSPAKFLHPFTLSRGVIVTTAGAKQRTAKDPMAYGIVGAQVSADVSFDGPAASITNASATTFDRRTNVLTWQILGDMAHVDHFIVMKQVHGVRTVLGKAHSQFSSNTCQFIHSLRRRDVGALSYVIVPVFNDYTVGQEALTNALVVEEL